MDEEGTQTNYAKDKEIHKALHPRDDRDSMSRKEGGRKLASIKDYGDATIRELEEYTK